jgi:hypothetical protein
MGRALILCSRLSDSSKIKQDGDGTMRKTLCTVKYMLAVVPLAMALMCSAKADTIDQDTFTVHVTSGPAVNSEAGDIFTGSFTYDATTLAMTGTARILSFTFTDPAWAGQTLSSTGVGIHRVDNSGVPVEITAFFFAPSPAGAINNAFAIENAFPFFTYGSTVIVGGELSVLGEGSVTYGTPEPVTTPEPSSLALMPLGLGALLLMRKRMGHRRPEAV